MRLEIWNPYFIHFSFHFFTFLITFSLFSAIFHFFHFCWKKIWNLPKGKAMKFEKIPIRCYQFVKFSNAWRRWCKKESLSNDFLKLSAIPNKGNSKTKIPEPRAMPSIDLRKRPISANEANLKDPKANWSIFHFR